MTTRAVYYRPMNTICRRAGVIGITWPVPEGIDDGEMERRLFTPPTFEEKPSIGWAGAAVP